jgi:plastocyanin
MSRKGLEIIGLVLTCAAATAVAGCGMKSTVVGTNAEIQEPAATVKLTETEYKFNPASPSTKSGLIRIEASNAGREYHALRVVVPGAGGAPADNLQQIADTTIGEIGPGGTETLNLKLKPGTYTWYCPLSNHRELGMRGKLKIQ